MPIFSRDSTGLEVIEALTGEAQGKTSTQNFDSRIFIPTSLTITVVITGPSVGSLGAEAAKSFVHGKPQEIILVGRTKSKIAPVMEEMAKIDSSVKTRFISLDLSDLGAVRTTAEEINESVPRVDILICSAGIMGLETYTKSKDGYELQFASCHLGHFLLTGLLLPKLVAAKKARVVSLTSMGYEASDIRDDWNFSVSEKFDGKTYNGWLGYGQAKTAVILFTLELAKRGKSRGIEAFVLHPGMILSSGIMKAVTQEALTKAFADGKAQAAKEGRKMDDPEQEKTLEQGCSTTLVAALDPSLTGKSGAFLKDCAVATGILKPYARDEEKAANLWALSENLVGEKFLSETVIK
ncbi:hypothetical protein LTR49_026591 [Elasticomyces elasticus]|nr:hypothetical protein LTR49_026591 [Elasticomyces elasticus]